MKKVIIFFISLVLLTGCANKNIVNKGKVENSTTTSTTTTTTSLNTENTTASTTTSTPTTKEKTTKIKTTTTEKKNTTAKSTTTKTTNSTTKKATALTKIKEENKSEVIKEENKYGSIFQTIKTYTLITYSDNSTKETNVKTSYKTDYSGYKATTNDLKSEAAALAKTYASQIKEVVKYTNQYREEKGLAPLELDETLTVAAMVRALEMAYSNYYSHTRPNGTDCFSVLDEMNIRWRTTAENIAYGYTTASAVSNGWRNSSGHYANMTNPDLTKIGVGFMKTNTGKKYYWVQLFT